ncbi:serine/threonine protein kinase, CMGC group [Trichoderma citrinoviride]|uniref:cyclin-dependent kinase n=1 Tax=Trichoderma citrinoviride TaxID=58853 RepID=A0A2T4B6D8_9HYPO|nr:serine/threonine protein kinase, CMGC group [Trichoderma citrinoviride]PTB64892.1 serine/threonine protein kinase, CMGC group [Trichoderma citrinoviride]
MASSAWKASVSSVDRYDTISKIMEALPSRDMSEAIAIEQAAYDNSSSLEEYTAACQPSKHQNPPPSSSPLSAASPQPPSPTPSNSGIRIGSYTNCTPISDGVTSEVFRSGATALKVIVHSTLEPHNPLREVKILQMLHPPCIPLLDSFRDHEQRLVLAFPYMPLTLDDVLYRSNTSSLSSSSSSALDPFLIRSLFRDILEALREIHGQGIVHRDIKPSAILLASPSGPAYLSDFGTAWHPTLSATTEPPDNKILDIGTGPYRAPEVLFGNKAYGPPVDMWALGTVLAECIRSPPAPLFDSRPAHEDGNQLGLILSIFKTLGTPTPETWPEAKSFKVTPFELWTVFPQRSWEEILPGVDEGFREAVGRLVRYDGSRATAEEALTYKCFTKNDITES